jgi:hypothetical protein
MQTRSASAPASTLIALFGEFLVADHMTAEQMSGALLKAADDISRIDVAEVDLPDVIEIESVIRSVAGRLSGMAAVPELTDAQIVDIAVKTRSAEPGRDGYILPVKFARAVLAAAAAPEPPHV